MYIDILCSATVSFIPVWNLMATVEQYKNLLLVVKTSRALLITQHQTDHTKSAKHWKSTQKINVKIK